MPEDQASCISNNTCDRTTTNGSTAIRDKILASLARYRALRIGKFPCAFWRLSSRPGLTAFEAAIRTKRIIRIIQ
ncbi:hypothetical protein [Bathymodiolus platifrons methanotrophic gill symbiont]|uniref:hypothetical protein n=1 Tax=Bathymodiolus platifrons methanotrophic gill symbiont TaxID=113268 RepID=UPI001C8E2611|nr:hypothetical protein [Bathymodiolus platifrons methanotrophic gill symbiont]